MIKRFASLIRRIAGRVKRNMSTIWFGLGIMVLPISAYIWGEQQNGLIATLFALAGVWAIVMALVEKNKEDKQNLSNINKLISHVDDKFDALINEVKELQKTVYKEKHDGE